MSEEKLKQELQFLKMDRRSINDKYMEIKMHLEDIYMDSERLLDTDMRVLVREHLMSYAKACYYYWLNAIDTKLSDEQLLILMQKENGTFKNIQTYHYEARQYYLKEQREIRNLINTMELIESNQAFLNKYKDIILKMIVGDY